MLNLPMLYVCMALLPPQFIDVPGTIAICKALHTNKHLQFIDLGMNRVRKVSQLTVCKLFGEQEHKMKFP